MKYLLSIIVSVLMMSTIIAQDLGIVARTPSVSPDGKKIAFSYQGDIWVADANGMNSKRLTIHEAYESNPVWNDQGTKIAFSGNRFGNNDIFVISADGGAAKRITYHSASDLVTDWTSEGHLIFNTARLFRQVERDPEIHIVDSNGGTPTRYMDSFGSDPKMSPSGRFIAHTRGNARISREAYDGPADRDIWIYDTSNETYHEITENSIQDFMPVWGSDDRTLYFISAESGRYNIYKVALNGDGSLSGSPEALTTFSDEGVRFMDISAAAGIIIFEKDTHLYTIGTDGENLTRLEPDVTMDDRFDAIEYRTFTDDVDDFSVSPDGELITMTIRGEVFVMKNDKENDRTVNLSDHSWRDRNASWINDSTVIFTSDRDGQYDLYMARSSDPEKTGIYTSLRHEVEQLTDSPEDEMEFVISPDQQKIAYVVGRGKLVTADIDEEGGLSNKKTLLDGWDSPGGLSWSPDGKYLAYSLADLNFDNEIYIHAADNSMDPVNVSMHPKSDYSPVWSRDGSKLGFISNRNNQDYDLWYVWLNTEDYEKTQREREDGYYFDDEEAEDDEELRIDFEDIHERLYQLTFLPGNEGNMAISEDGETFYFSSSDPDARGSDIYSVKFDRSDLSQVTKGGQSISGIRLSADGKELMGTRRGRIVQVNPGSGKVTNLPFRARMTINHALEREQILEEGWRELDKGFYDPDFHGRDWEQLKAKYKPWALKASTRQDFIFMVNWMLGQLNASHMGLRGGSNPEDLQDENTGLIGVEVEPERNGVEVTHVVPGSPAHREKSLLSTGDVITMVDGVEITENMNYYSTLINKSGERVLLEVINSGGDRREMVIEPVRSLRTELYEEYVDSRKKLVDEYSEGKLGYIHIRAMNYSSFERFERELKATGFGKEGIVIDVRWNGGGSTTDLLMAVLNVQQHAYTVPRGAAESLSEHTEFTEYYPLSRLPLAAWYKPSIAMSNETSYSNAEIFSHAFKNVGIGKLVGMPTFGAVISTGAARLMDGSYVRMPFRGWFVKATGENMEHGPAVPDIIVQNEPHSKAKGEDPQLKRAVEELLKDI